MGKQKLARQHGGVARARSRDALEHSTSKPSAKSAQALTSTEWKPWADKICAAWQKATESIIATGKLLIEAKQELAYGSFEAMVQQKLPFSPRAARMLMAIAHHPVISDRKHVSVLPPSWGTLYELTRVPDATLREKIASGAITPKIERKDVVIMRPAKKKRDFLGPDDDDDDDVTKVPDGTLKSPPSGGVSDRGRVKKPTSDVPKGAVAAAPARDPVKEAALRARTETWVDNLNNGANDPDGELALLREFARFVIERTEGMRVDPKDHSQWKDLPGRVKAILPGRSQ